MKCFKLQCSFAIRHKYKYIMVILVFLYKFMVNKNKNIMKDEVPAAQFTSRY